MNLDDQFSEYKYVASLLAWFMGHLRPRPLSAPEKIEGYSGDGVDNANHIILQLMTAPAARSHPHPQRAGYWRSEGALRSYISIQGDLQIRHDSE
ncbi:MAG: hypothetical protein EXR62_08755 [Chloroflexi bacterium]|nr:hypothetical protein [Chloroflexota bacterium]